MTASGVRQVLPHLRQAAGPRGSRHPAAGPSAVGSGRPSELDLRLLRAPHPGLRAITVHRYPLSACSDRGSRTFPTIARILSENATAGMARSIRGAVRTARRAGLPVRLTEINSVTCGGRRGVSNTFATALWAPDALFELLRAGASAAAVHVRARAINMAFSLTRHGLVAYPLLYGLSFFQGRSEQMRSLFRYDSTSDRRSDSRRGRCACRATSCMSC